jgi:formate dehydrogenase maturation protein FdhE
VDDVADLSPRTRDVIAETASRHADDAHDAGLMAERLGRAVARRLRLAAEARKVCGACGVEKPVGEFARDNSRTDGRYRVCVACHISERAG